jgi:hypothetical protein
MVERKKGMVWTMTTTPSGPVIVSVIVTLGFIASLFALMYVPIDFKVTSGQAFLILIGGLAQAFATVVAYWLGSSASSAVKNATIAALAIPDKGQQ